MGENIPNKSIVDGHEELGQIVKNIPRSDGLGPQ